MLEIQLEESEEALTSAEVLNGVTGWHLVSLGSRVLLNFSHPHIRCSAVFSQLLPPLTLRPAAACAAQQPVGATQRLWVVRQLLVGGVKKAVLATYVLNGS